MVEMTDKDEEVRRLKKEVEVLKTQLKFLLSVVIQNGDRGEEEIKEIIGMMDLREEPWLMDLDVDPDLGGYTM